MTNENSENHNQNDEYFKKTVNMPNGYCSNCKNLLDKEGHCLECDYCPDCGSLLNEYYFCPECDYCPDCGKFTDGSVCNCTNAFIVNASEIESEIRKIVLQKNVVLQLNQKIKVEFDGENYYTIQKRVSGGKRRIFFKNPNHWNTSPVKTLKHICFFIFLNGRNIEQIKVDPDDLGNLLKWGLVYQNDNMIFPTKNGYNSFLKSIDHNYRFYIDDIAVELRTIPYIGNSTNKTYSIGNYYKVDSRRNLNAHEKILSDAVIQIKEKQNMHFVKCISKLISWFYEEHIQELESDIIVPVPCYNKSFCHTYEIAKLVKADLKIELQCPLEKRYNTSQDGRSREERWCNAKRSYALSNNANIHDKTVLLIDDIYTTGATINTCKDFLYDAGAKKVNCLTVTRTRYTHE